MYLFIMVVLAEMLQNESSNDLPNTQIYFEIVDVNLDKHIPQHREGTFRLFLEPHLVLVKAFRAVLQCYDTTWIYFWLRWLQKRL